MLQDIPYKISVITVCRNVEKCIAETMDSVLGQTYENIEYILIDGNSTDNTANIIGKYALSHKIKYISEPDKGIYNAMNKGIGLSTGDYLIFINAGDGFWNKDVVKKTVAFMNKEKADIYYGNCVRTNKSLVKEVHIDNGTLLQMLKGKQPYHQCTFAAKNAFEENMFDETYKVRSDFNWFLKCKRRGYSFRYMDIVVSKYAKMGYSGRSKQRKRYGAETAKSIKRNFPLFYWVYKISSYI